MNAARGKRRHLALMLLSPAGRHFTCQVEDETATTSSRIAQSRTLDCSLVPIENL